MATTALAISTKLGISPYRENCSIEYRNVWKTTGSINGRAKDKELADRPALLRQDEAIATEIEQYCEGGRRTINGLLHEIACVVVRERGCAVPSCDLSHSIRIRIRQSSI
jgi:hypothetical protein